MVDAESVFSNEIIKVNERLRNTSNYLDMIPIVEDFLLHLVGRSRKQWLPVDKVSHYLLNHPNSHSLDWLAGQACLSQRQFYRQFMDREGISPKLYARIARFENAMKIKNGQPQKDWFAIAIDLGYYDYQHLVRDFKEFTSLTPAAYYLAADRGPEKTFGISET
ncbi:helix-turn-helix domain-containing protein [Mucilaginibacter terrae]|uniref:helix-turn-helix domain-containing protein n=1 Tax=Mucilaginibacter terrae TaxID=1955052 RepID=UPI0036401E3C